LEVGSRKAGACAINTYRVHNQDGIESKMRRWRGIETRIRCMIVGLCSTGKIEQTSDEERGKEGGEENERGACTS